MKISFVFIQPLGVYMKKTLLNCVALSALFSISVLAQEAPETASIDNTAPIPAVIEVKPGADTSAPASIDSNTESNNQKSDTSSNTIPQSEQKTTPTVSISTDTESPTNDTFVQAELEAAFQAFIADGGLKTENPLIFEQRGRDFLVTIPELKVPVTDGQKVLPAQTVTLTRVEDFATSPQFQVKMDFLTKMQSLLKLVSDDATVDADRYVQDMLWVPRLQLISNNSIQAENLTLSFPEHMTASIKSMVSDVLAKTQAEAGKMDVAGASDAYDITVLTPFAEIIVPRLSYHHTLVGTEITGDEALQTLTAAHGTSSVEIPEFTVSSLLAPDQKLSGGFVSSVQFLPTQIQVRLNLKDLKLTPSVSSLIPEQGAINVILDNLKTADLIHLWHTQKQIQNLTDKGGDVSAELEKQLENQIQTVLKTLTIRIPEVSAYNNQAGIKIAGVAEHLNDEPQIDLTVSITNFDLISPPAKKIDTVKCTDLVQQVSENQNNTTLVHQMQVECMPETGILEDLRPYLSSAAHTVNEAGQPVDTFLISYQNRQISINGQPLPNTLLPTDALKPTKIEQQNTLPLDEETPHNENDINTESVSTNDKISAESVSDNGEAR